MFGSFQAFRNAGDLRTPLGTIDNTSTSTFDGALGGAWVNGWGHTGASLRFHTTEYGVPSHSHEHEDEEGHEGHSHDVTVEMDRVALRGQVHWTRQAAWFDHVELNAKGTRLEHLEIEGGGAVGTRIGLNTGVAELVGRHSGTGLFDRGAVGARIQRGDYDATREGGAPLDVDEWDAAIYALEEWDVGRAQLQIGGRFDYSKRDPVRGPASIEGVEVRARDYSNVAGSLSALYRVFDSVRLGAAFTRAFRTPSSDELYSQGAHLASYTFEVGNPELEAEVGHGVDVFVRVDRPSLRGEVAAFWNRIDDFVHPANTGVVDAGSQLFVYRAANTGADFRGAEAALRWSPLTSLAIDGSVSYVHAQNRDTDEPLPLIPPLQGNVALRYELPAWFAEVGWHGAAAQDRVPARPLLPGGAVGWCDDVDEAAGCVEPAGEFLATDGYGVWSAAVGVRWFAWGALSSFTLTFENLTDEVYRNHLSRIKEVMPEAGRSVNLVYRLSF